MSQFDLNLSTTPFPAYRLIHIALASILVILVIVSVWQAFGFVRYSALARSLRSGEQEARVEADALETRLAELESRLDQPEAAAKLNEIGFLNRLIARRNLSWTRLFANLEGMVPDTVHLVNLSPDIGADGIITLHISLRGRSIADVTTFIERLEKSPVFEKVIVTAEEKRDALAVSDVDILLSTLYYPQRESR